MRYWLNAGFLDVEHLVLIAREAERLGFEGIALPDHLVVPERIGSSYPYSSDRKIGWPMDAPWPDCWVAIGAMTAATERLRFTTSVFVPALRDVFQVAKSIGTAVGFGPGRVSCGLGAGWMREEFDSVGRDFQSRGRWFDELLEVLPLLWSGAVVEYHGEHIDFGPLRMCPAAGALAVLVGGNAAPALRRAARVDGWIGAFTDIDGLRSMVGELTAERERRGRSDLPFEIVLTANVGTAKLADDLGAIGVDGLILPAAAMATATDAEGILAGISRFADRWMPPPEDRV